MRELMAYVSSHRTALTWVSCLSLAMFVGSLLLIPWLVGRAPRDYFVRSPREHRGALAWVNKVLRNLLGVVLMLAGLAMLVLPGQGLLMVLLALTLLDFPGKQALIHRIVLKKSVWRALTYLRERAHREPFEQPTE
jgi:hypothetical protein